MDYPERTEPYTRDEAAALIPGAMPGTGPMSFPQGKFLGRLTHRPWWEHDQAPSKGLASALIDCLRLACKARAGTGAHALAVEVVQRWYPDFSASELHFYARRGGKPKPKQPAKPTPKPYPRMSWQARRRRQAEGYAAFADAEWIAREVNAKP